MDESDTDQDIINITAGFPDKLIPSLFARPWPKFRVYYGGRASGKSWGIARMLLLEGIQRPLRILATREYMSAVDSSIHTLIKIQIDLLGLHDNYRVEQRAIYGSNGTQIRFAGIANHIDAIRSYESIDVTYVEEAEAVSRKSWDVLIPTVIRKPGSSMIISFNPGMAKSETYQRWVVNPPPDSIVTKINYTENPFCSSETIALAEDMKVKDPDGYQNVWLGFPIVSLVDAIYGKELRAAQEEGRITKVPYDPSQPVHTFWDLGRADYTAVIFAQCVAMEYRVIDFFQDSGKSIHDYLKVLQAKDYVYGTDYLPHDARAKQLGSKRSIEEIMRVAGRRVSIVPRLSVADGISAGRMMWTNCYIDERKCAKLLDALREYRYDPNNPSRLTPLHDEFSHAGDAWRYMGVSLKPPPPKKEEDESLAWEKFKRPNGQSWMNV